MKNFIARLTFGILATQLFFAAEVISQTNKSLPKSINLVGLKQDNLEASDLKNKVVVMQFWASWCKNCGSTMKALDKATQGKSDVKFVTVSVDEDLDSAKGYFDNLPKNIQRLETKAYFDSDAKLATRLDVGALPAYMVIDSSGKVLETFTGHPNQKDLSKLKKLMTEGRNQ